MDLLWKAFFIAKEAHRGQVDKAGRPYIFHPLAVAKKVSGRDAQITALLHDVVEDSIWTVEQLAEAGFSVSILDALALLTKDPSMEYMEYIRLVGSNPLAKAVKLADLEHNSDLKRLPQITHKDLLRWEKYQQAMAYLQQLDPL